MSGTLVDLSTWPERCRALHITVQRAPHWQVVHQQPEGAQSKAICLFSAVQVHTWFRLPKNNRARFADSKSGIDTMPKKKQKLHVPVSFQWEKWAKPTETHWAHLPRPDLSLFQLYQELLRESCVTLVQFGGHKLVFGYVLSVLSGSLKSTNLPNTPQSACVHVITLKSPGLSVVLGDPQSLHQWSAWPEMERKVCGIWIAQVPQATERILSPGTYC